MSKAPTLLPFRAVRYNLQQIPDLSRVIAPPYDVISAEQQQQLYTKDAHNIAWLDVTQEGTDEPSDDRYAKAARDFQDWQKQNILSRDAAPGLYVYEQTFTDPLGTCYTRRGFYGLRRLEAFGAGKVYPHEQTLAGPKKDRLKLMKATDAQLSPIFGLFHESGGTAATLLANATQKEPLFDIQDDNNQSHRLWYETDPVWIEQMQAALQEAPVIIADGHHRYETALAYKKWRDENRASEDPAATYKYVLMFCEAIQDPGLVVLPTHRLVQNRSRFSEEDFLAKVRDYFQVEEFTANSTDAWVEQIRKQGEARHCFGLMFQGDKKRYVVSISEASLTEVPALAQIPQPLRSLDAKIVHSCFLEAFLGFTKEDQEDQRYIQYLKSEKSFVEKMQNSGAQMGVLMNAAPLPQIRQIAEAGLFMPPKTTYFYPKLPTGLVINYLD